MPGTPRPSAHRARLEAQARALREQGRSMAEVERETGVPASTLYQWAAKGGWRGCDLAEEALRAAMQNEPPGPQGPQGRPPARSEGELCSPGARTDRADAREDRKDPVSALTPGDLRAEADACAQAAMALSRAGRMKEAEAALKLAERYRGLAGGGGGGGAGLAPLSSNEALILSKARLRHAPHVIYAIHLVTTIDARRAREGEPLWLERDYGMGPWAEPEQIAAFKAAARAGPVTPPKPLPVWNLPDFSWPP